MNTARNNDGSSYLKNIKEGLAYEVVVSCDCDSYSQNIGTYYIYIESTLITQRDCKDRGDSKLIFYADRSGNLDVKFIDAEKTSGAYYHVKSVIECSPVLSEPPELNEGDVYGAIASIPQRVDSLESVVACILPQVDKLFVYLNGYQYVPGFIKESKIEYILDPVGRDAAATKLWWLNKVNGYYFSLDDDIVYPSDYVKKTIHEYESMGARSVVSYHGKLLRTFAIHPTQHRKKMLNFQHEVKENTCVHVIGTGVMMLDTRKISLPLYENARKYPKSIDLAVSIALRESGVKRVVLKHESGWLRQDPRVRHGLNEYKQINKQQEKIALSLMMRGSPWVSNGLVFSMLLPIRLLLFKVYGFLNNHKKIRKFIYSPRKFLADSKLNKFKQNKQLLNNGD